MSTAFHKLGLKFIGVAALLAVALLLWVEGNQEVAKASFGVCGTANSVVAYIPGADLPANSPYRDPQQALGPEDGSWVSLGQGGTIVLRFPQPVTDGAGPDLDILVLEVQSPDGAFFEVSQDGVTFVALGPGAGSVSFDLSGTGLTQVNFIRITDDNDGTGAGSNTSGFDLDAVEAFNCAPAEPPAPAIDIEKSTNGEDADTPTGPIIPVGSAVTWTYIVTNTGNVPLSNVTVTDDQGVAVSCPKDTLAVGESMTCTASGMATAGQYANVGTATGQDANGTTVTDSDPSHYFGQIVANPAIDIEKFVLVVPEQAGEELCAQFGKPKVLTMRYTGDGDDATSHSQEPGKVVVTGDPNNASPVRILVTNKSNPADSKAKVFFDGTVSLGGTFDINAAAGGQTTLSADTYVFVYSQANTLLQTVKFHTSCSQPLFLGDQFGSIQLVGFLNQSGQGDELPDSDPGPGEDADAPPGPTAIIGSAVTWTYIVTNTGDVPLSNVTVTDDQGVAVSCPKDTLAVGESMTCTASGTATAGQYANIGTATGQDANGTTVTDSDPSHYFGVFPEVNQCIDHGKPKVLTMRYTGDGDDATSHSQEPGKVVVTGDPNNASPVRILVTNKSNPADSKAKVFFDGTVSLGGTLDINAAAGGQTTLSADTYVFVYSQANTLLQTVKFHTSCSQPLFLGDQFGSIQLVGFVGVND